VTLGDPALAPRGQCYGPVNPGNPEGYQGGKGVSKSCWRTAPKKKRKGIRCHNAYESYRISHHNWCHVHVARACNWSDATTIGRMRVRRHVPWHTITSGDRVRRLICEGGNIAGRGTVGSVSPPGRRHGPMCVRLRLPGTCAMVPCRIPVPTRLAHMSLERGRYGRRSPHPTMLQGSPALFRRVAGVATRSIAPFTACVSACVQMELDMARHLPHWACVGHLASDLEPFFTHLSCPSRAAARLL